MSHNTTASGQVRAPGRHGVWEHYGVRDGLPDLKVECVFEDSRGELWSGLHNGGLVRYRRDAFEIVGGDGGPEGVYSILEAPDGDLWCGTSDGIWRWDGQRLVQQQGVPSCQFLWGSAVDGRGHLWFGAERQDRQGTIERRAARSWRATSLSGPQTRFGSGKPYPTISSRRL